MYCAYHLIKSNQPCSVVTFSSPGIDYLIPKVGFQMSQSGHLKECVTYHGVPDLINTRHRHHHSIVKLRYLPSSGHKQSRLQHIFMCIFMMFFRGLLYIYGLNLLSRLFDLPHLPESFFVEQLQLLIHWSPLPARSLLKYVCSSFNPVMGAFFLLVTIKLVLDLFNTLNRHHPIESLQRAFENSQLRNKPLPYFELEQWPSMTQYLRHNFLSTVVPFRRDAPGMLTLFRFPREVEIRSVLNTPGLKLSTT